jgi:cbb3-type cytochrome oxidase maturation protein
MEVLYLLIPISFILGFLALFGFIWAAKSGQFEDLKKPSESILFDD